MDSRYVSFIALALGVVAIILSFGLFYMPIAPLVLGIAGIVLGHIANKIEKNAIATTGFVLSVISVVVSAFFLVVVFMFLSCAGDMVMSDLSQYESIPDLFKGFKALT